MNNIESQKGEIVMYQPDETIRLEVRMEGETVWLNQAQMAELFGTKRQAITKHLQNIYDCDELKKKATSSILELVRKEGKRTVKRKVEFYNLDAIISVGFRVNTKRGIEFRQWANQVLKDYLLKGYVVNQRITAKVTCFQFIRHRQSVLENKSKTLCLCITECPDPGDTRLALNQRSESEKSELSTPSSSASASRCCRSNKN